MEKSKIRIGIIGAGRMGLTHLAILKTNPDIEIAAITETNSTVLSLIKKYLNVETFTDFKDMINNASIDALVVCTPPNINYDILTLAASKNIHAFVEKPFTIDPVKGRELDKLYTEKKLVNQVGYVNRFNDVFRKVKELLAQKLIGDVISFKTEMYSRTVIKKEGKDSGWRGSKESGGGVVFEMASHSIDLINYMLGKPDRVTGTVLTKVYSNDVDDIVSTTMLYNNGLSGTLYVNWSDETYRKPVNKIEFLGKEGKIVADQYSVRIYLKKDSAAHKLKEGWNTLYITDVFKNVDFYLRGNEFTTQLYHFVDCIRNGSVSNCTFGEATQTIDVIASVYQDFENSKK